MSASPPDALSSAGSASPAEPPPLRLGLLGTGQAARALGPRWQRSGHPLAFWRGRNDGPLTETPPADVLILAVPDSALPEVAAQLATRESAASETWLHLSGALPAGILRLGPTVPAHVGGLHPLVALAEGADPSGATAGLEGDAVSLPIARRLAEAVGLVPLVLTDPDARALYHAAAVTVAGHATALFSQALRLMAHAGLDADAARRALQPLLLSAAKNLATLPPARALTGPTARGDASTIARHLAALTPLDPSLGATYRLLSREALTLAEDRLSPEQRAAVLEALSGPSPL